MPLFRVAIAPGVAHVIDAATEEEARKKTRAEIAKGAVSPFYDDLYFDYETGVDPADLPKDAKSLRQKLGRAEVSGEDPFKEQNKILDDLMKRVRASKGPLEQEGILQNSVGSGGYIRNTKGQVALTPQGLQLLGLPVQQRKLQDGTIINLNTVIDENSFNLKTGDLADFSGIAGPVIGTIAAFMPQTKVLKAITSLAGGRERIARTFAAGIGSVAGKAGEEYLDTQEGFQLQDKDELSDLYKEEFVLGSVGQALFGELPGMAFKSILGKRAPLENQRAGFVASRNLSWADVKRLDREKGRPLSNDEILKAAKQGKVQKFEYSLSKGFLPARKVYDQRLPATYQGIFEQVLGSSRDKPNVAYLRAAVNSVLKNIKNEKEALNETISLSTKRGLDEQVNAATQKLRLQEQNVTNELRKLLGEIGDSVIEAKDYGNIPANRVFGQELKDTMNKARNAAMEQSGESYHAVDQKFINFKDDRNLYEVGRDGMPRPVGTKTEEEYAKSVVINKAINNIILKHLNKAEEFLELDSAKGVFQTMTPPGAEINSSVRAQLQNLVGKAKSLAEQGKYDLRMVRNDSNFLNRFLRDVLEQSDERKLVINVARMFDDYGIGKKGIENTDSILTELQADGMKQIELALENTGMRLRPEEKNLIDKTLEELRIANKNHFDRMEPFDSIKINGLIANAAKGSIQADDVYTQALLNGKLIDLENIFKALRDYDEYIQVDRTYQKRDAAGNVIENYYENKLKADLKNRLFADALREATKDELTDVNFTQFAKEIKRFEKEHGKFRVLFQDSATGKNTADEVLATINQLNEIGFSPKPQQLRNIINDITQRNATRGLDASAQGRAFVNQLERLAEATEDRIKFEANRAISQLPDKTIEETVNSVFKPGTASTINALKETVSPEVFQDIQRASMQKLLSKSIDMNGQGKITDLFKSQNLKTSLDSYGDETLDAMFGAETRRGLRDLQQQIDILTGGEPGRGGAAGGLVAAGISAAIVFQPLTALPTVAGLAVARFLLTYPPFVRVMSRSDPGSIARAMRIFNTSLRQFGLRYVNGEVAPIGEGVVSILDKGFDAGATALGITDEEIEEQAESGINTFQQLRDQVLSPIQQPPALPQVQSPDLAQAQIPDPLSDERIEFAERVAGRPILG